MEQVSGAEYLDELSIHTDQKAVLVLGNEVKGVSQLAIDACDTAVEIPQLGTKHSLNVATTAGVVLWHFFRELRPTEH